MRKALAVTLLLFACAAPEPAATKDDLGRDVAIPAHVRRVITLAPNVTEIVFAIGAGETVVGTDDFSNYPPAVAKLPKVGGMQPNIEKIVQLEPDLVLASTEGNHPNLARALAAAKIPLYVVRTDRLQQIAPAMQRLGAFLEAPRASEAIRELEAAVAAQKRARDSKTSVLFAVWTDPLYVAGRATFMDDLYALTGAQNAVALNGWPQYSLESFVAAPPQVFLYPKGSVTPEQVTALFARAPHARARIVAVDQDIFQRPGPRMAEAAKVLNGILDQPRDTP
ncbi:MAG TPA: helical backbone metal receptor [Thermoanaerobaculia bacterium]|nr:helical backbone metal receptor [Thermoanaerobaculia bacterium]